MSEQRAAFVGVESQFAKIEEGMLVFSLRLSRPLTEEVSLSLNLFGCRKDRPFQSMPKLRIVLGARTCRIFDQGERIPQGAILFSRRRESITVRIPLAAAGNPHRLLISTRTYLKDVPLDWGAWRVLDIVPERGKTS